jgi:Tfp pilus assembly protein PilF
MKSRSPTVDNYRKKIALYPENLGEINDLGKILFQQHRWTEAIALYQRAIALHPNSASLYNYLGYAQWQQGNTDPAISSYRRAIELEPNLASTYYNLGKIWQAENDHAAAVACFLQMMKLQPNYIPTYSDCGYSLMAQGKVTEAMACFREAIARQPLFVESFCQGVEQRLIATKTELDEWDRAKIACAKFLRALQQQFDAPEVREYLLETYTRLGNVVFDYGADRQAAIYYEYALQIDPDNPLVNFKLGQIREKQQLWQEAIACYRRVLAADSLSKKPPFLRGVGGISDATLTKKPPFRTPSVGGISDETLTKKPPFRTPSVGGISDATLTKKPPFLRGVGGISDETLTKKPPFRTPSVGGISDATLTKKPPFLRGVGGISDATLTKKLLPNTQSTILPQGIYQFTQKWILHNQLSSHRYIPIHRPLESSNLETRQFASLDAEKRQCEGINCQPCSQQITQWFNPVHLGSGLYQLCFPTDSNTWQEPETFVARIPEGRVWIAPHKSDWQICNGIAVITPDNYLLADLSRAYPGQLPGCQNYDPKTHRIFQLDSLPKLEYIDGTVAILSGLSAHIYFHWLVDILPRWQLLRFSGIDLSQIDWFVVNSIQQPFQRETIQELGFPESKIIESDRYPHLQAKELVVPSFPRFLGWLSPWALQSATRTETLLFGRGMLRWLSSEIYYGSKSLDRKYFSQYPSLEEFVAKCVVSKTMINYILIFSPKMTKKFLHFYLIKKNIYKSKKY